MAFNIDTITTSHHLVHGAGFPAAVMGTGPLTARGTAYIEGPAVFGDDKGIFWPTATVMITPDKNIDTSVPLFLGGVFACGFWNHSPYSLHVFGDAIVQDYLDVTLDLNCGGNIRAGRSIRAQFGVYSLCGFKPFAIPHPDPEKKDWTLVHNCIEGPEVAVYCRGRVKNSNEIELPDYWKHLVHENSITVSLTPVGSHQDVIVKRIQDNKILLQSKAGMPIDCYYHVYGERKDIDKLIVEFEGTAEEYIKLNEEGR